MSGKVCYDEVDRIKRVVRKDCLRYPSFMKKMSAYRRALRGICLLNGLDQQFSVLEPPAAYLKRLDERKSNKVENDAKVNKANENKSKRGVKGKQKFNRSYKNYNNAESGDHDDTLEIERFPVSNNLVFKYKKEEAKRCEESRRIYATVENVTKELAALDLTIELKIQQLKNIVKEHSWSNSEATYKENLLNQASSELVPKGSLIIEENLSTTDEAVSKQAPIGVLRPKTSLGIYSEDTDSWSESADVKPQKILDCVNFNSNSCRSRYVKNCQMSLPLTANKDENSCHPKVKKKTKTEVLTDSMIKEKFESLKKKFLSDVNPHEVIFLEMPDEEDQNLPRASFSDVTIDIPDDITAELPSYCPKNTSSENSNDNSKPQLEQNSSNLAPVGTRLRPNFILRNKLLAKRPSVTLHKITNPGKLADTKLNNETDSDSDDSRRQKARIKKNNYAHIVSQYAQFKPVVFQRPKLDREILTADLCKPFFIQAERLLQAEKVLKKTRQHSHAGKKPRAHYKI